MSAVSTRASDRRTASARLPSERGGPSRPGGRTAVLALAVGLGLASATPAVAITAEALQASVTQGLATLAQNPTWEKLLHWQGEVGVTAAGADSFRVTLPTLRLGTPDIQAGVWVGAIELTVTETQDPRYYDVAVALPREQSLRNPDGTIHATITLGRMSIVARWDRQLEMLTYLQVDGGDVVVASRESAYQVTTGDFGGTFSYERQGAEDTYDGSTEITINEIVYASQAADNTRISAGSVSLSSTNLGVDLPAYDRLSDLMSTLSRALEADTPEGQAEAQAALGAVIQHLDQSPDALGLQMTGSIAVTDLRASVPSLNTLANIGQIGLDMGAEGIGQDRSRGSIGFIFQNLVFSTPGVPVMAQLLAPVDLTLRMSLSNLPSEAVWGHVTTYAREAQSLGPELAMGTLSRGLQQALAAGDATVTLDEFVYRAGRNPDAATVAVRPFFLTATGQGSGTFVDSPATPLTGTLTIVTQGLDEMVTAMQSTAGSDPLSLAIRFVVSAAAGIGERGQDAQGRTNRTYAFALDEQGEVLLRGRRLSDILAALSALQPR